MSTKRQQKKSIHTAFSQPIRPRRNRKSFSLREMVAETSIGVEHLVMPLFLREGRQVQQEISAMPGISRFSLDLALSHIAKMMELGLKSVALFPYIETSERDKLGTEALNPEGLIPRALQTLKKEFPELLLFSDIALDPFSSEGHDGIIADGEILNDETVAILAQMSVLHGQSGADFVAPSDMMDGRVGAIRSALDKSGLEQVGILSYAAKYSSSFYGPFREALESAPKFGDKKTYQMDYRNSREALREVQLDVEEGADIVMVKPALAYLDIIAKIKAATQIPVAAYNVSGEYAMVKAAAQKGWINETQTMIEVLYSMRRAGADLIFTYFAESMAVWLSQRDRL